MNCPSCRRTDLMDLAEACSCGYQFNTQARGKIDDPQLAFVRSIDGSLRTIRRIMVFWTVVGILAAVLGFIIAINR